MGLLVIRRAKHYFVSFFTIRDQNILEYSSAIFENVRDFPWVSSDWNFYRQDIVQEQYAIVFLLFSRNLDRNDKVVIEGDKFVM